MAEPQISSVKDQVAASPLLFIVGATATGKSDLALRVAAQLDGEIICADSQTIRRALDIGTAKPTPQQQSRVKHHLIDEIEPYDTYSVAQFKKRAEAAVREIRHKGKLPIVVGGSGLYVDALFFDYDLLQRQDNDLERERLELLTARELQEIIHAQGWTMPENSQNPRHLIGTILRGGKKMQNNVPIDGALIIGLQPSDEDLKVRIRARIETMLKAGLVEEVRAVLREYGPPPRQFDAICYPIIARYLEHEITLDEAIILLNRGDWQYARRQKAWFKRNPHIIWFTDVNQAYEHIESLYRTHPKIKF